MAVSKFNERAAIQPALLTFLRIIAGVILIYKTFVFIRDAAIAKTKIEQTGIGFFSENSELLALVITYLGLLCGLFITIGLFTRLAAIVQIPILLVAVFLVNYKTIGTNVFEAQHAERKADFIHKMKIAVKEANETLYWLLICEKSESYPTDSSLKEKTEELIRIISRIILSSKGKVGGSLV